ncbi:MAG TPA: neutral zinc metallopeptidase [Polyangiaceae bacterium]|nr:neutral zinc metallopeptidase [Polyangiaceae bacterium]
MRWDRDHQSEDVVDERGAGGPSLAGTGILFWLVSRFGLPGLLVGGALLAANYFLSGASSDPRAVSSGHPARGGAGDETAHFVAFVLDDVQSTWQRIFAQRGLRYTPAKLVLFTDATRSACGTGTTQAGPFYCPGDRRVYIDLSFYRELAHRFGAPGDFAQAYVIAHEVGHHVQNLLEGQSGAVALARGRNQNAASIRIELQADCYAGIWAHSTEGRNILDPGDIEEGLRAAAAVGDDTLQRESEGQVHPETWTHGSSAQRVAWFRRGYQSGKLEACETNKREP